MPPEDKDKALTNYVLGHYQRFFTAAESRASLHVLAEEKAKASGGDSAEYLRRQYVSHNPEVLALLADGVAAFRVRVRDRLLAEHADQIHLNRCPKCQAIARTPTACLCPSCNHTWYELRQKRNV